MKRLLSQKRVLFSVLILVIVISIGIYAGLRYLAAKGANPDESSEARMEKLGSYSLLPYEEAAIEASEQPSVTKCIDETKANQDLPITLDPQAFCRCIAVNLRGAPKRFGLSDLAPDQVEIEMIFVAEALRNRCFCDQGHAIGLDGEVCAEKL